MPELPARASAERGLRTPESPHLRIQLVAALGRELGSIYTLTEPLCATPASVHRERLERLVADHIYPTDDASVVLETYRGGDMEFSLFLSEFDDGGPQVHGDGEYTVYVQPSFVSPGFVVHATYFRWAASVLVKKDARLTAIEAAFTRFLQQLVPYVPNETTVVVEGCG